jgi:hypothetical protein
VVKTAGNSDSLSPIVTAPVPDSTDLQTAIIEVDQDGGPLRQGVIDGSSHQAPRQEPAHAFQSQQRPVKAFHDHAAFAGAHGLAQCRPGTGPSQVFFDGV